MAQAVPFIIAGVAAAGQAVSAYKKSKYHTRQALEAMEAKNRRMAAATREAQEERRRAAFLQSRARAVSAASGGGSDAGMVKIFADLAAEGEYRVLSRVWQGQNDAEGLLAQADAHRTAARDAKIMGVFNTVTTAFSTYAAAGGSFGGTTVPSAGATSSQGLPYSPSANPPPTQLWSGPQ